MALSPSTVIRGNPPSADHQIDPLELVQLFQGAASTVNDLFTNTSEYTYTNYSADDVIVTADTGFRYKVVAAGAAYIDKTTDGGLNLLFLPLGDGYHVDQWGASPIYDADYDEDDADDLAAGADSTDAFQSWFTHGAKFGGRHYGSPGAKYKVSLDRSTTDDPFQQAALVCEVTDNSIAPAVFDMLGAEIFVSGTGSGRVANGSRTFGGAGEYGAFLRLTKPTQATRSARMIFRNWEIDMSGFTNPMACILVDDWEKALFENLTVKDFNPDDDWCFAFTVRNIEYYSERTHWFNINTTQSTGGIIAWLGSSETAYPVSHTDHAGISRTAGDAVPGTDSFARTTVQKVTHNTNKKGNGYAMAFLSGTYDSYVQNVNLNGGNIGLIYYDAVGGGTVITHVNSEQPRGELSLTGSIDVGVSDTTLTLSAADDDFGAWLANGSGAWVTVAGAGAGGADLVTRISSHTSTSEAELRDAAGTTVSGASVTVHSYCGVEVVGSRNAPAVSYLSAGGSYKQIDWDAYTGSSNDDGNAAHSFEGNLKTNQVVIDRIDGDTGKWMSNPDADQYVYPVMKLDNVSIPDSTATEVVPASILQEHSNGVYDVKVYSTGTAYYWEGVCKRASGSTSVSAYAHNVNNASAAIVGGALQVTQTSGSTQSCVISVERSI